MKVGQITIEIGTTGLENVLADLEAVRLAAQESDPLMLILEELRAIRKTLNAHTYSIVGEGGPQTVWCARSACGK